ncbi:MAG: PorT family protein [Maribacter sp.]|nr:PorT family protein [Maribacter sp.]
MKHLVLCYILCGISVSTYAQSKMDSTGYDTKYLEDQFYVGITYNFLLNKPKSVTQRNLSYGLQGGIIKDLPINSSRTRAFGIGIGYAFNSYYSTLLASQTPSENIYTVLDNNTGFKRNKVETHMIEFPLEYRWRNSTPQAYKFWRIYAGAKLGYVLGGRSKFVSDTGKTSFYNTDLVKFHYGLMLNFGYNTFNIHAYYALNTLFKDTVSVDGNRIDMKPLRIGLIFYIL